VNVIAEGAVLGAYRLVRRLGAGGMGEVWLGEHSMLGRCAAVKLLHESFTTRQEIVTRFFNEARAATAISDPGIVQVFDFGQHTDGTVYIVMELLDGEALDRRLARQGALAIGHALHLVRQVASSLGAAHASGIVHRDLKPENIFIVPDPEVAGGERTKILDFGIAKLAGDDTGVKTQTSALMGTPVFMSPEQCRGAGQVDQRSDIYSLGCVLFLLLTGRPPFDAEGSGEIIAMHLREPPPVPSSIARGIPVEVDALILRCLSKDPAQRFASGTALAAALGVLLGRPEIVAAPRAVTPVAVSVVSVPTTLSAASSEVSATSSPRRRIAMGVAALVLATAIVGFFTVRGASDPSVASTSSPIDAPPRPPLVPVDAVARIEPDAAIDALPLDASPRRIERDATPSPRSSGTSTPNPRTPDCVEIDKNGMPIGRFKCKSIEQ